MTTARRFENAGKALAELQEGYNRWTSGLASRSVETAFGVLAAHWAVFQNAKAILSNWLAIVSIAIVVIFLGWNLLLTSIMAREYGERCDYADEDKARWQEEFDRAASAKNPWPYTDAINKRGDFLLQMRTWLPLIAGGIFLFNVFFGEWSAS